MRSGPGPGIAVALLIALFAAVLLVRHLELPSTDSDAGTDVDVDADAELEARAVAKPPESGPPPHESPGPEHARGAVIHFDFEVDHGGREGPDFQEDLEAFGLAHPERPELAHIVSKRIAQRALARVERAYPGEPRRGEIGDRAARDAAGRTSPPIRFVLSADAAYEGDRVTRICVGGVDPSGRGSIGLVRFDPDDAHRESVECSRLPPSGIFARELTRFSKEPIFREVFGPFVAEGGAGPIGSDPADARILASGPEQAGETRREREIARAIEVFGNALGTILAHEAAHALGLVPDSGTASTGHLARRNPDFAHNRIDARPDATTRFMMDPGERFDFAALAGLDAKGREGRELEFLPEHLAYLRGLRRPVHDPGSQPMPTVGPNGKRAPGSDRGAGRR